MSLYDGALALFNQDEAAGAALDALSGLNLTAQNSPGTAAGLIGTARAYLGTSSQNHNSANTLFNPGTGHFSCGAWCYHTIAPNGGIIRKGCTSEVSGAVKVGYGIGINSGGPFLHFHDGVHVSNRLTAQALGGQTQNTWWRIDATFDRAGLATLYLNGSSIASVDISAHTGNCAPAANLAVGSYSTSGAGFSVFYTGRIDLVTFHNRCLSADEVAELYNSGAGVHLDPTYPQIMSC